MNPISNGVAGRDSWDVLDQFLQELQTAQHSSRQFRLLLQAVHDSLEADAVFLHSPSPREGVEMVSDQALAASWCRQFADRLLRDHPDQNQFIRSEDLPALHEGVAAPQSAALLQVSRSRNAWVIALRFQPNRPFQPTDLKIMKLARRMLSYHYQQLYASDELKDTLFGLVYCLTASIDAKDPYTCGHSERVARIAVRLGQEMGVAEAMISDIYLSGLLHDIGKIGIKDSVLQKPGRLTPEEMLHVQEHPVIGDRIISNVKKLAHLRPGVRNHHERFDGAGYPDRLAGQSIPLMARILAVADSCDAMMSPRPYRRALPTRQIEKILREGAGTQWDPQIVRHFLSCRQECYSMCQRGIGESVYVAVEHAVRAGHKPSSECASSTMTGPRPAGAPL